jgi:NSS family neurotransmitter:Na+ symporter
VAIAMMKYGLEEVRREMDADSDFGVGAWWTFLIRIFPVMFAILFGWFLYQSVTDATTAWWNPFDTFSLASMVVQWVVVAAILLLVNNALARRVNPGPLTATGVGGEREQRR